VIRKYRYILCVLAGLLHAALSVAQETSVTIVVEGVDAHLETNILASLGIKRLVGQGSLDSSRILSAHRRAPNEIERALQPFGYYRPIITSKIDEDEGAWTATYRVDPGSPVLLTEVIISATGPGEREPRIVDKLSHPDIQAGRQLNHASYEDLKAAIFTAALASGYLDAEFAENTIEVHPEDKTASIRLILDTGPLYRFGPITIEQDILDQQFVDRFNRIEIGQAFNSERILELKLALANSGYFSTVDSEVLRDDAVDYHVPVIMRAAAAKPMKFRIGAGYGTDIGPRVSLGAQLRRVNRRGHQISSALSVSEREPVLSAQYAIPIRNVRRDQFAFTASISDREYAQGDGQSKAYELGMSQNVELRNWTRRLYLKARHDNFFIGDDIGITTLLIPGVTLSRLRNDDSIYTRRGYSLSLDIHGSAAGSFSDETFVNTRASAAFVHAFTDRSRLLLRGHLGVVEAENFENLPPEERFFAGGDKSVRGYAYQSISPRDEMGNRTGGKYLYSTTVEIDHLFYKNFGGAVFVDVGTATNDIEIKPKKGVGFGFRWASPVGMARVDLAWPLDKDDGKVRLHISIGPDL
jgi:translocation and assembly module TamA